ncbi:MAG: NUDIX-like domain-containing protein, partial [Actinomycetes bacterium]
MTPSSRLTPEALALARSGVDRVTDRREDAAWLEAAWTDLRTRVLVIDEGRARVSAGPDGVRLVLVPPASAPAGPRYLLGEDDDGVVHFAVPGALSPDGTAPDGTAPDGVTTDSASRDGVRLDDLRGVGALLGDRDAGLLVHAVALDAWHRAHPRCPRCGA